MSDLAGLARHLEKRAKGREVYIDDLKRSALGHLTAERLVQNIDTGTLIASETYFAGEPVGQNLPYQTGHSPQGDAEREAVLRASGPLGAVGVANDAHSPGGVAYGTFIEARFRDHEKTAAEVPAVLEAAAPAAWAKGQAEAGL